MVFDFLFFFFQAEDGIRDLVRSRGLGDVYKRQPRDCPEGRERARRHGPAGRWRGDEARAAAAADSLSLIHI